MRFEDFSIEIKMKLTEAHLKAKEEDKDALQLCNQLGIYIMLGEFYDELKTAINDRLVLTDLSWINLKGKYDVEILHQYTGLSIKRVGRSAESLFMLSDFQTAKSYVFENELIGRQELDFATLATAERARAWKEAVSVFAKTLVQRLERMLDTTQSRIYGLDKIERLDLGAKMGDQESEASCALMCDDDPEWMKEFYYCQLNLQQIDDLKEAINTMISHADISFTRYMIGHHFTMEITHCEEKTIPDALLDYDSCMQKNAIVSPELKRMFNEIVRHLENASDQLTLKYFDGLSRKVFKFDETERAKWRPFGKEVIKKGKHWSGLVEQIERPDTRVIKAEYEPDKNQFIFSYKLKEDAPDWVKLNHWFENAIENIIETKTVAVANTIVNKVLCAINSDTEWAKSFWRERSLHYGDNLFIIQLGEFDDKLKDYTVDISKILNSAWLGKLNQHILEIVGPKLQITLDGEYGKPHIKWCSELH